MIHAGWNFSFHDNDRFCIESLERLFSFFKSWDIKYIPRAHWIFPRITDSSRFKWIDNDNNRNHTKGEFYEQSYRKILRPRNRPTFRAIIDYSFTSHVRCHIIMFSKTNLTNSLFLRYQEHNNKLNRTCMTRKPTIPIYSPIQTLMILINCRIERWKGHVRTVWARDNLVPMRCPRGRLWSNLI